MGYDKQISQDEINELKSFVSQTGALGFGRAHDEVSISSQKSTCQKMVTTRFLGLAAKATWRALISTEEFKDRWLDYALRQKQMPTSPRPNEILNHHKIYECF
jgi:hypothetical protein